jgi:hypothetical protein
MAKEEDEDFEINIEFEQEEDSRNKTLKCLATLSYIGNNEEFNSYLENLSEEEGYDIEKEQLSYVNITFYSDSTKVKKYEYDYHDEFFVQKTVRYKKGYNGYLYGLYNKVTEYQLDKEKFTFLHKLKGIAYGMLLCCICKAFTEGLITKDSNIILEASGNVREVDAITYMNSLVRFYNKIGFTIMFPEQYEYGISLGLVPMVGKVKDILSACTFKHVSDELRTILPIKYCEGLCED